MVLGAYSTSYVMKVDRGTLFIRVLLSVNRVLVYATAIGEAVLLDIDICTEELERRLS